MMKLKEKLKKRGGFTLIEMLIVVAIVAILVVISIPMVNSSLDKARQAADDANERAAKAVAAIEYLTAETAPADTETYYFDADSGTMKATAAEVTKKYGQTNNNKDKVVKVTVTKDGKIDTDWE